MLAIGKKLTATAALAVVFVFAIPAIGMVVSAPGFQAQAATSKTAIVYFSGTGTTKAVAKKVAKATKGTLLRIKASDPYTDADLDYDNENSRVVKEHESASTPAKSKVRPKIANLKKIKKAVKKTKTVYIGYPIWWREAPHILYTLVESVSLKGKKVIPFSTSASSGIGSSAKHLKVRAKISAKTKWRKGKSFYGPSSQKTVNKWVRKVSK